MTADKTLIRALLIDNDAGDRSYIREQLDKAVSVGFELTEAALIEGSTGLVGKDGKPFDVILLSLDQPGCTGLEALQKLLPQAEDVPIVVLSGHELRELGLDAVRQGAEDYLVKGKFECELLVRTIRNATERAHIKIEHKKAEEALRSSQSFFQLILNSMPISIAYVEKDETITFANQNYLDWFRVRKPELIGKKIRHITSEESYEVIRPRIDKVLAGELVTYSAGAERDMQNFELEVTYIPHHDDSGNVIGFFSVVQDMTQHRRLEAELRQAQKMEAVGQLTGGVAHDFNNLLTVIVGNLQLLSRPLKGQEKLTDLVDSALKAASRGAELTKRLLALSRRQVLKPRLLDVNQLVMEMDELLRRTLGNSVDIETRFEKNLHPATIDPGQLESALLNLTINARDAMWEGGQLLIETKNLSILESGSTDFPQAKPGEYVSLSVSDTGCGMTSDVADRAFEPFFTTKDVGKGSGLGLSLVHGFVEKSDGFISITSSVGIGTRVKLLFPMASEAAAEGKQQVVEIEMPRGDECILVVEDDNDVRKTTMALLIDLGYTTLEAGDGPSALRVIESHPEIDLLFSDVMMPGGMRGPVLAQKVSTVRPDLPVLFATGFAESTIMYQGMEAGPDSVICKPYGHDELARKIRRVLDAKNAIASKKAS